MGKSKVLVVGGTGFMGRRLVRACLAQGHETYVLKRDIGLNMDKLELLISLKKSGARFVEGSLSDHRSLVEAVKLVDVVISAVSHVQVETHGLLEQLKLVEAIKEAGNVKRFLPSEFGMDPPRMGQALHPGRITFDEKMVVRKAIEEAQIPHTYVSSGCLGAYFGGLAQMGTLFPPKDRVTIYGDGNVKAVFVDEDDVATYAVKTIDDPRTLNKTIYIRPPENVLSQMEFVEMWEKLSGNKLIKNSISVEDFLARLDTEKHYGEQVGIGHFYHIFYEGCLTNYEVGDDEEASKLYPQVNYTRMDDYLKRYL